MNQTTAPLRILRDPAVVVAKAKTAGDRAEKTTPLEYGARTRNYVLQNGHHRDLTPRQSRRRLQKQRAFSGAL